MAGLLSNGSDERLSRKKAVDLLCRGEPPLLVCEAVEDPGFLIVGTFGALWKLFHRSLLVFTQSGFYEVALDHRGRVLGGVRHFAWSDVPSLGRSRGRLVLGSGRGALAWRLLGISVDEVLGCLAFATVENARAGAHVAGARLPRGELPWRRMPIPHGSSTLCHWCQSSLGETPCQCNRVSRSPRLARLLSLAFPGGGILYSGHWGFAIVAGGWELLITVACAWLVFVAEGLLLRSVFLIAFLTPITGLKLENLTIAARLSRRGTPLASRQLHAYRYLGAVGGVLTLVFLVGPLLMSGIAETQVTRNLRTADGSDVWARVSIDAEAGSLTDELAGEQATPTPSEPGTEETAEENEEESSQPGENPELLDATSWSDGEQVVEVSIYPLPRFVSLKRFTRRLSQEAGVLRVEAVDVGHHSTLRVERDAQGRSSLSYLVIDAAERDVHELTILHSESIDSGELALRTLIRRSYFQ